MRALHHGRVSVHRAQVPADRQRLHCQPQQTGNKVDTAVMSYLFDQSLNQFRMKNQNKTGKGKSEKKGAFAPLIVKLIGGWSP